MNTYQHIFNRLRCGGLTEAAAIGFLGNWQAESGNEPNRLQGDFSTYRSKSKDYTAGVMNGSISRYTFGTDQKGYGLAQWTYVNREKTKGRKYDLYDFWRKSGKALDSIDLQIDFALWELQHGYGHVLAALQNENDVYSAVNTICRKYEQPAVNNVNDRFRYAQEIKAQIDLNAWQNEAEDTEAENDTPASDASDNATAIGEATAEKAWPPRVLCLGMAGADVVALQGLLLAHGYYVQTTGTFDQRTKTMTMAYQAENNLDPDGIAGPLTFGKLTEMR